MEITTIDKIRTIFLSYSVLKFLPSFKQKLFIFLFPVDTTRFFEFPYLIKFIKKIGVRDLNILDVSSPHIMSYYLAKENKVIKTNIDEAERKFIKENSNLTFKIEDATRLSFPNNTFDLTYSISVIEHIYNGYTRSIQEMIRVTKKNGYIYLTFPVAQNYKEEWLEEKIYSNQFCKDGKAFFFYRLGREEINFLLQNLKDVRIIKEDIFWERENGLYDKTMYKLKSKLGNRYLNLFKDILVNYLYGFTILKNSPSSGFENAKSFGNIHLILQKI